MRISRDRTVSSIVQTAYSIVSWVSGFLNFWRAFLCSFVSRSFFAVLLCFLLHFLVHTEHCTEHCTAYCSLFLMASNSLSSLLKLTLLLHLITFFFSRPACLFQGLCYVIEMRRNVPWLLPVLDFDAQFLFHALPIDSECCSARSFNWPVSKVVWPGTASRRKKNHMQKRIEWAFDKAEKRSNSKGFLLCNGTSKGSKDSRFWYRTGQRNTIAMLIGGTVQTLSTSVPFALARIISISNFSFMFEHWLSSRLISTISKLNWHLTRWMLPGMMVNLFQMYITG